VQSRGSAGAVKARIGLAPRPCCFAPASLARALGRVHRYRASQPGERAVEDDPSVGSLNRQRGRAAPARRLVSGRLPHAT